MRYIGDFNTGSTIRGQFNTRTAAGVPITLGGTPVLSVYKGNSTTESTAGVSLTVDFDSRTGLHLFTVDTSADGTFYAAGEDYRVVVTTGTVDSVSVVGHVVGMFSLANRSALRPTAAGRTLDVSLGGEAGIDLANVGSPTTTLNLSGTTIATSQVVASVTGNVGGNVAGSVGSVSNFGTLVSDIATAVWAAGTRSLTTFGTLASDVWAVATRTLTAASDSSGVTTLLTRIVGTLASGTHNAQSGDSFARLGAPTGASIAADIQTRLATSGYTAPPSAATISGAVWDLTVTGHTTSGTFGAAMNAAGSSGDPWSTALPGSYAAGTAGYIVGTNLNATVSSRLATSGYTTPPTTTQIVTAMGTGTFLTAIPWNAAWDAEVQSECADALAAYDGPTNAEMEARTILAASYATATELAKVIKSGEEFTATDGIGSKDVTHTRI